MLLQSKYTLNIRLHQSLEKLPGSMENKGMEFAINANWFQGDFSWSTDFNISFYKNKILSLDKGQYQQFYDRGINAKITSDVLLRVGMPVGIYYGYISDGTYKQRYRNYQWATPALTLDWDSSK